jgi:hypothetical protein
MICCAKNTSEMVKCKEAFMQFPHKIKGFAVGAVGFACLAGVVYYSPVAYAFPFQSNPQSFQNYMNSRKWNDGIRKEYSNFHKCVFGTTDPGIMELAPGVVFEEANCQGYVKRYTPQGVQVCRVGVLLRNHFSPKRRISYDVYDKGCRWA